MTTQAKTATLAQVMKAFGVAHMTIYNWRHGTPTKTRPLPAEVEDPKAARPRVFFKPAAVKKWAEENGVEFAVDLDKLIDKGEGGRQKPGPKAATKAKASTKAKAARKDH
jgi:hypothetical protein